MGPGRHPAPHHPFYGFVQRLGRLRVGLRRAPAERGHAQTSRGPNAEGEAILSRDPSPSPPLPSHLARFGACTCPTQSPASRIGHPTSPQFGLTLEYRGIESVEGRQRVGCREATACVGCCRAPAVGLQVRGFAGRHPEVQWLCCLERQE